MMSRMGYSVISATTPAPTVRPPSRIANRNSFSIPIGWISSIPIVPFPPRIPLLTPPLPKPKPQLLLHPDRLDQLDRHRHVVPRHHHLPPPGQRAHPRHVRRPEVKLRPIPVEERRVPPPLVLAQHV